MAAVQRHRIAVYDGLALASRSMLLAQTAPSLGGQWKGSRQDQSAALQMILRIQQDPGGKFTGTLESADYGVSDYPIPTIISQGPGRRARRGLRGLVPTGKRTSGPDLADGTWQIWRDGKIVVPAVTVSSDAGTLYFEGPPGRYELRR